MLKFDLWQINKYNILVIFITSVVWSAHAGLREVIKDPHNNVANVLWDTIMLMVSGIEGCKLQTI